MPSQYELLDGMHLLHNSDPCVLSPVLLLSDSDTRSAQIVLKWAPDGEAGQGLVSVRDPVLYSQTALNC